MHVCDSGCVFCNRLFMCVCVCILRERKGSCAGPELNEWKWRLKEMDVVVLRALGSGLKRVKTLLLAYIAAVHLLRGALYLHG